jgi:hypothetical protein
MAKPAPLEAGSAQDKLDVMCYLFPPTSGGIRKTTNDLASPFGFTTSCRSRCGADPNLAREPFFRVSGCQIEDPIHWFYLDQIGFQFGLRVPSSGTSSCQIVNPLPCISSRRADGTSRSRLTFGIGTTSCLNFLFPCSRASSSLQSP